MMTVRNTTTGAVLENMVLPSLIRGGYSYKTQVSVGKRPHGGTHKIDIVSIDKEERKYLISLKWQQTSGTAEQKIPFEVMCLIDVMNTGEYHKAYLILAGIGWTLKEFYIRTGLEKYMFNTQLVKILDLEHFIALANNGKL
jgi:hypothetical protein